MEPNAYQMLARIEKLESLAQRHASGGSLIPFGASNIIWRPGAVSTGNVYGTWPEVVAAVAALNGEVSIGIDTTIAPATIPVGAWNLRPAGVTGPVTMVGATPTVAAPFVTIANAAVTIHGLNGLLDVQIDNRSTSNVMTTGPDAISFFLRGFAAIGQSVLAGAGVSFFHSTGGIVPFDLTIYMGDFSYIGSFDGGVNAVRVDAALSQICVQDEAIFDTNQLVSPGTFVNVVVSATTASFTLLPAYGTQALAPLVVPFGYIQWGTAAIVVGTGKTAAIPAFITSASRIEVALRAPVGDALTVKYAALLADRVNGNPGSFQVSALAAAGGGAVNGVDTSTVDYVVYSG